MKLDTLVLAVPFWLSASCAMAVEPPSACAALSFPSLPACVETPTGVVLATNAEAAEAAAAAARQGEASFQRYMGVPRARYAVIVGALSAPVQQRLRSAGYRVVLPWLSPSDRRRAVEASTRRAVEAQMQGREPAVVEAAVAQALAQVGAGSGGRLLDGYSAVAHELGHLWFKEAFWPDARATPGSVHYGGPGPDWLDEAAAIALEDEPLTAPRRERFRNLYEGRIPGAVEPLATFFTREHPLKGLGELVRSGALGNGARDGVTVLAGAEAARRTGTNPEAASNFYAQARVVADFLQARSGEPTILADFGRAYAAGGLDVWLAREGRARGLGSSIGEMETIWRDWLQQNYDRRPTT